MMRAQISAERLAAAPALVDDHARGACARTEARIVLVVERAQRAQVDHLGLDALAREPLGGRERLAERCRRR